MANFQFVVYYMPQPKIEHFRLGISVSKKVGNAVTRNRGIIITLPRAILLGTGLIGSLLARMGIRTALHYSNMCILCVRNYYSGRKAVHELGMRQTPVETALSDAIAWFREAGMLKS